MRHLILITSALLALLIVGCNKIEPTAEPQTADGQIVFGTAADWTRGVETSSISDVADLTVYSFATAENWLDEDYALQSSVSLSPYFTSSISTPFTLTQQSSDLWSYDGGSKYWPVDGRKLSFFAHYPQSELSCSIDQATGMPLYNYTLDPLSRNNDDLVVDALYDLSDTGSNVEFDLQHALTKISLQVKLEGSYNSDGSAYAGGDGGYDGAEYSASDYDSYAVNGVVFYNVYDNASLAIDVDESGNRSVSWIVDESTTTTLSSTQGQTLIDVDSDAAVLNNSSYTDVMADSMAIFTLPQTLSTARTSGDAPTAMVRVRRVYYTDQAKTDRQEIVYESQAITIPYSLESTTGSWDPGQHVQLLFTFNIGSLSEYDTPLTVSSEILDWTPVTVTADIHSNLYIYASTSTITVQEDTTATGVPTGEYFGEFMICTNYDYNLRVPHHREELDGAITSSRGFLFLSDDFNKDGYFDTYADNTNHVDEYEAYGTTYKAFVPTLISTYDNTDREIIYATKDNIKENGYNTGDLIYEYKSGFNSNSPTSIDGTTVSSIVYGSNDYAYIYNSTSGFYRLLYIDPKTDNLTAFNYDNNTETGYHEIILSNFADDDGKTVKFKINIGNVTGSGSDYTFDFWVTRSTRLDEGLYVSTAISGTDNSYGVNKQEDDAVYILRLSVDQTHLANGDFDDIIGVEMISNGGGMITTLFPVTLSDTNDVIPDSN